MIYYLVKLFPARSRPQNLLLIKTDEIGDYVLFRHLLKIIRESPEFKHHRITFIGNKIFRPLFEYYDSETVDAVLWLDKKEWRRNFLYRYRFLKTVRGVPASVVINFVYSRSFRTDDVLAAISPAARRMGMKANDINITTWERRLAPRNIYTTLLESGPETMFDAIRNVLFAQQALRLRSIDVAIDIPVTEDIRSFNLPDQYFVVFPGSGGPLRKWPAVNFARTARFLVEQYGLVPVVCGSAADEADCRDFVDAFQGPLVNLCGSTTLPQLLGVLKKAACLVSVDTGSVHLAAAVGCPVFAVFSGKFYGRFAPYPSELAPRFYAVFPDSTDRLILRPGTDFYKIPIELVKEVPAEKLIDVIRQNFTVRQ